MRTSHGQVCTFGKIDLLYDSFDICRSYSQTAVVLHGFDSLECPVLNSPTRSRPIPNKSVDYLIRMNELVSSFILLYFCLFPFLSVSAFFLFSFFLSILFLQVFFHYFVVALILFFFFLSYSSSLYFFFFLTFFLSFFFLLFFLSLLFVC